MDNFNNLVFVPNVNRPGWNIATMSWGNEYGIIVNEEESSRLPAYPNNKYQVCCTYQGNITDGIVIPGKLAFICTPDEVTMAMEGLQRL